MLGEFFNEVFNVPHGFMQLYWSPLFLKARRERPANQGYTPWQTVWDQKDVPRNEPCPCGSNKKFKKCCYV